MGCRQPTALIWISDLSDGGTLPLGFNSSPIKPQVPCPAAPPAPDSLPIQKLSDTDDKDIPANRTQSHHLEIRD